MLEISALRVQPQLAPEAAKVGDGCCRCERLGEELVGEALPGGCLLQLMDYRGDDIGRDAIYRTTLRLLEKLFGGTPIRVWNATWFDVKNKSTSPWAWLSASEWIFETHTGNYLLVLAHDG